MQETSSSRASRFKSRRDYQDYLARVFKGVVSQYLEVLQLPPVCAIRIDPESSSRSRRLTQIDIDFKVDTERITEAALRDRKDLQSTWFRLAANDEMVDPKQAHEVIARCGRLYAARGLAPWFYYRQNKHPHPRKQVIR
jgi:hypothetical protein